MVRGEDDRAALGRRSRPSTLTRTAQVDDRGEDGLQNPVQRPEAYAVRAWVRLGRSAGAVVRGERRRRLSRVDGGKARLERGESGQRDRRLVALAAGVVECPARPELRGIKRKNQLRIVNSFGTCIDARITMAGRFPTRSRADEQELTTP